MGLISRVSSRTYRDANDMTKLINKNTISNFLIILQTCAFSQECNPSRNSVATPIQSNTQNCEHYPIKTAFQLGLPWISKAITFNSGFHGYFNFTCGNFKEPTWVQHKFPDNVFIDIDEINRLTHDPTSVLNGKFRDIQFEKYPVDIEAPVWLETGFWVKLKCDQETKNFEFPVHIRYHRADYGMPHEISEKTFSTGKFLTTICSSESSSESGSESGFTVIDKSEIGEKSIFCQLLIKKTWNWSLEQLSAQF